MPDSKLKAIIGLGNPGSEYERTRHNAGFWFVDQLAASDRASFRMESKFQGELARIKCGGEDLLLFKPMTFMNRSGEPTQKLDQNIGQDYLRLRIGIGHPGHKDLVHNYVLGRANKADEQLINDSLISAAAAIPVWLTQNWDKAVHQLHSVK